MRKAFRKSFVELHQTQIRCATTLKTEARLKGNGKKTANNKTKGNGTESISQAVEHITE